MGRFDTLNPDTQDMVTCLLPALATAWNVEEAVDIIPEDIRMRAWDCERRDHIKSQTENDPRNWGVQFLKDLMAIARVKKGVLDTFHDDLRVKIEAHEDRHPWCRLSDIRQIRDEYENPNRKKPKAEDPSDTSSTDSYLEELVEPDLAPGEKRKRGHELYEARIQPARRKYGRLRRNADGGFHRKDVSKNRHKKRRTSDSASPVVQRRRSHAVPSDGEEEEGEHESNQSPYPAAFYQQQATPSYSMSPAPPYPPANVMQSVEPGETNLEAQALQAELEVAEAELRAARLKQQWLASMKKTSGNESEYGSAGPGGQPYM